MTAEIEHAIVETLEYQRRGGYTYERREVGPVAIYTVAYSGKPIGEVHVGPAGETDHDLLMPQEADTWPLYRRWIAVRDLVRQAVDWATGSGPTGMVRRAAEAPRCRGDPLRGRAGARSGNGCAPWSRTARPMMRC